MAFVGIDIGTFETKGVVVDADGQVIALSRRRHGISTPYPGHVEQDPLQDWWADLAAVASDLMDACPDHDIEAIGVSAIGPCVVAVDENLHPLRPAILYGVDTRAVSQVARIGEAMGAEAIFERAGNPLTSQSAGPKIAWIKDHEPEVWRQARWFLTSQSWLVAKLTGEVVIDHATAGYFHPLYDLAAQAWNVAGCEDFIDADRLPRVEWSTSVAGHVHADAASQTGLPAGVPVIVGTTDSPAEAVAAGVVSDGALMAMYGSSGYFIRVSSELISHHDLWAAPFVFPDTYVLAAGTATTGTATRWLADLLDVTDREDDVTFSRLLDLAHASPVGARGVLALPHFAGERTPFQDPHSRAAIVGMGLEHTRADVARAVLESVGHAVAEALLTYSRANVPLSKVVAIGGATKNPIVTVTASTVTGITQHVAQSPGAAFGDAFLAAVATGAIVDPQGADSWWTSGPAVEPDADHAEVLKAAHRDFVTLYQALAPFYQRQPTATSTS